MGPVPAESVQGMGKRVGESRSGPEPRLMYVPEWLLNLKISNRLTFWFLAISIVPCLVVSQVTYRLSERSIEDTIHSKLLVTAEQKSAQIETYAAERIRSIDAMSHTMTIVTACRRLAAAMAKFGAQSPSYVQAEG